MAETNNKKILICDDDRTHLLILNETFTAQGFIVEQAINGELAIDKFNTMSPDIVLLDVGMPMLNGYEVCTYIRASKQGQHVPILMITGSDDQVSIEKAFEVGATDFLPKPINWSLVQHRVKYMLRSHDDKKSLVAREKELQRLAYYDPLTQLPNRQYFTEHLTHSIALSKRKNTVLAAMFIDLDSFKRINETLGHSYGDFVLKQVAQRLTKFLRAGDVISRANNTDFEPNVAHLGSDEYSVILMDCGSCEEVMSIAKRLLDEISKPIVIDQYSLVVTASIGISIFPTDGENAIDLLKYADMAMYEAKSNGKSCFRLHSKELQARSLNRLRLEEYMREALKAEMFELYYQPQINALKQTIKGAEALLRLHHKELGIISPAEFIPVAEDTGLIVEIGYWVIQKACLQLVDWEHTQFANIVISVNVSVKQINQEGFVDKLKNILQLTGVNPALLELELTESIIMSNPDENITKLNAIKQLGVKFSIDDFGTGYSSLSYLKKFPLDTLKIDRAFVMGLTQNHNSEDAAIIGAISAMAKALKLDIVVEGVETLIQLDCINKLCGHENILIQGYYYSKPLPVNEFSRFITENYET